MSDSTTICNTSKCLIFFSFSIQFQEKSDKNIAIETADSYSNFLCGSEVQTRIHIQEWKDSTIVPCPTHN